MTLKSIKTHRRRAGVTTVLIAVAVAVAVVGLAACGSSTSGNAKSTATAKSNASPPFKIALSNAYIGNTWRIEMNNLWKAATKMEPYKTLVDASTYNSGNDISAQIAHLNAIIASHVDAIVIDAASPTGLNGTIRKACAAGILVVSIDNRVTEKCAVRLGPDEVKFGAIGMGWLAEMLGHKGNIIWVTGVPGTPDDNGRNAGVAQVLKKNPKIKVISKFSGMWSSTTEEQRMRQVLTTLGNQKIDGVWASGGTDGSLHALEKSGYTGKNMPLFAGEGENGLTKRMLQYKKDGWHAISVGEPPYQVVLALAYAVAILQGSADKKDINIYASSVVSDRSAFWSKKFSYPIALAKLGVNVFPKQSDSWFQNFQGPAVKMCLQAAVSGKPCPFRLVVNQPGIPNPK